MKGQLVYVMGPSGAGKDSLIAWLKDHLPPHLPLHLARRTITRPIRHGDEQHHSVSEQAFALLHRRRPSRSTGRPTACATACGMTSSRRCIAASGCW